MTVERDELIDAAKSVVGPFTLRGRFSAGTVAAALLSGNGTIYTGICVDLASGLGFCAEVSAVAEMLKDRQTRVIAIVAVGEDGNVLGAPCGRCRETLVQIDERNLDCVVVLQETEIRVRELLPKHWLPSTETRPET